MGQPVANANFTVVGVDTHIVMVPTPGGPVPTPLPHPFQGTFAAGLATTVKVCGAPAVIEGSIANATPPHIPTPPGASFQKPPANQGKASNFGSATVKVMGARVYRVGDPITTCNDPSDLPVGQIVGGGTVMAGG
jgi:uncharacterized Zn-binding protein involved in type VI secretion